jgi:hypothetical protein
MSGPTLISALATVTMFSRPMSMTGGAALAAAGLSALPQAPAPSAAPKSATSVTRDDESDRDMT